MHKTTLEVDEDLVAQASAILGTRGLKATVHRALEERWSHVRLGATSSSGSVT